MRIDNETSDRYTIVDVFADDRQGLLHVITNAIFQLGLSMHAARISTRLDQVADVFYVTDPRGQKLSDPLTGTFGRRSNRTIETVSRESKRREWPGSGRLMRILKGGGNERS